MDYEQIQKIKEAGGEFRLKPYKFDTQFMEHARTRNKYPPSKLKARRDKDDKESGHAFRTDDYTAF